MLSFMSDGGNSTELLDVNTVNTDKTDKARQCGALPGTCWLSKEISPISIT